MIVAIVCGVSLWIVLGILFVTYMAEVPQLQEEVKVLRREIERLNVQEMIREDDVYMENKKLVNCLRQLTKEVIKTEDKELIRKVFGKC